MDAIKTIASIAIEAGTLILDIKAKGFEIDTKENEFDLVTEADKQADALIRGKLNTLFPNDLILSEESSDVPENFAGNVWIVDPLDGTQDFVSGGSGFTVMIGLCKAGVPHLGVVYSPVTKQLYYAEKGTGAFLKDVDGSITKLSVSATADIESAKLITRIVHGEERKEDLVVDAVPTVHREKMSGIGIILGLLCQAKADIYILTNRRVSKWDTCALQVILEESGGQITDWHGKPLDYLQSDVRWKDLFVATNGVLHTSLLAHIKTHSS
jgi:3'(2'), 5'-bisphosphate nucleotidase